MRTMKMRTFLGIAALSLFCMTAVYAGQESSALGHEGEAAPRSIANGAALFKRHCVMCHGSAGLGDGPAAKSLKGKLPNLSDRAHMSKLTDAQLHELIT